MFSPLTLRVNSSYKDISSGALKNNALRSTFLSIIFLTQDKHVAFITWIFYAYEEHITLHMCNIFQIIFTLKNYFSHAIILFYYHPCFLYCFESNR